ncbi:MAG TPA: hypothetical protein VEC06_11995 [Paucimonas sp.]|nr:hypothetical protein [Paucimonas sp.]
MIRFIFAAVAAVAAVQPAWAWDKQANNYRVSVDADAKYAHVEADVWVEGNLLSLYSVQPTPQLPNGQAQFIERLEVRDLEGKPVALADKGEGDFELRGDRRVKLKYDVRLEHDRYDWPGGVEEVMYHTDEGIMSTGYALFLVPGDKMPGETRVEFRLPSGWQARTPWRPADGANAFVARSRRELVDNVFFLGSAQMDQFQSGGITLSLVLGKRYWPQRAVFREMLERQLQSYLAYFGRPPLQDRYLIVINQGDSGDGGAFMGSFSQFLRGDARPESRVMWGKVLAHELLHFWNGHSLVPANDKEEWFKEGVTDYLTVMTLARNRLIEHRHLVTWLENLSRAQTVARRAQGLKMPIRDAAGDKHNNWLLVYSGGSLAALAVDVELRRATGDKYGLQQVMQALFAEFAQPGKRYTLDDICRVAKATTGHDIAPLLKRIVADPAPFDMAPVFAGIGLQLETFTMLEHTAVAHPDAKAAERQRFIDMFGMPF